MTRHPGRPAALLAALLTTSLLALPSAAQARPDTPPPTDPTDTGQAWRGADELRARVQPPTFPDRQVDVVDFGADPTGATKSTDAFAEAIKTINARGGGTVEVPAGEYLTGAIHLRSDVELHLADGATVRFSRDKSDYLPVVKTRYEGVELYNYSPFIYAYRVENVAVTGNGVLDGNADENNWWDWKDANPRPETPDRNRLFQMAEEGVPVEQRVFGAGHYIRPNFVQFYESRNILVQGVTLNNSPMWLLHPVLSENVTIDGVHLESLGPNNDGVDPESSRDVVIKNTYFNTGDDAIAIKSGRNADGRRIGVPSENLLIEDNHMQEGHGGVVIGSEMSGSVRNVYAQDNVMDSPNLDRALRIKTNSVRGGVVENVYFRRNEVRDIGGEVIRINFQYEEGDVGDFTPVVRNVYVEDLTSVNGDFALYMRGYPRTPISNINIIDSTFDNVADAARLESVQGLRLRNVTINGESADGVTCQGTVWLGVPETLVDSGVADRVVEDQWCLSEQFGEDREWATPGRFRAYVARQTERLVRAGVIGAEEKDALQDAAAATDIGARK